MKLQIYHNIERIISFIQLNLKNVVEFEIIHKDNLKKFCSFWKEFSNISKFHVGGLILPYKLKLTSCIIIYIYVEFFLFFNYLTNSFRFIIISLIAPIDWKRCIYYKVLWRNWEYFMKVLLIKQFYKWSFLI